MVSAQKVNQLPVPGTQRGKAVKDLTAAAEAYIAARDERMALTAKEVEAHDRLVALMNEHDLEDYVDDDAGLTVVIETKRKAKARRKKDESNEE